MSEKMKHKLILWGGVIAVTALAFWKDPELGGSILVVLFTVLLIVGIFKFRIAIWKALVKGTSEAWNEGKNSSEKK